MTAFVAVAVLFAAVLHAAWNALIKGSSDVQLQTAATVASAGLIAVVCIPWVPVPAREAWPCIGGSVAMHMAYYGLLTSAYRHGDLVLTYPLMRGVAPLLTTLLGAALLGEWPGAVAGVGIVLICAGVIALAARSASRAPDRRAAGIALANAAVIAAYTLIDGAGGRRSGDALGYTVWLFAANAVPCTAWLCALRGRALWKHVASHPARAAGGGALSGAAYAICIWAMSIAPISLVAALRETSVLFAAVIGSSLLRERLTWLHWAGIATVAAGIAATRLG